MGMFNASRNSNDWNPMMNVSTRILALAAVVIAAIGCGGGGSSSGGAAASGTPAATTTTTTYTPPNVEAGIPVERSTDNKPYLSLVAASKKFGYRPDPFALTKEEEAYDRQQDAERVMGAMGGFTVRFDLPEDKSVQVVPEEPQPYRRLAGVVVGDSVLAIIDMGNGRPVELIRPGMKVPDSEWTVVSIDEDKAVLHRDGPTPPHTVTVRLESPPDNGTTTTGFGGGVPGGQFGPPGAGNPRGKPSFGGMSGGK